MPNININNLSPSQDIGYSTGRRVLTSHQGIGLAKFRKAITGFHNTSGKRNLVCMVLGDSIAGRVASRFCDMLLFNQNITGAVYSFLGAGGDVNGINRNGSRALDGGATETTFTFNYLLTGKWITLDASGEAVRFFNSSSQVNSGNRICVYYLKEPGAGTFTVSTGDAINSGFIVQSADVSADDTLGLGILEYIDPNPDGSVKVEWVSGSVKILDVAWFATDEPRIDYHSLAIGGQGAGVFATVNQSMMTDLMESVDPDLIIFACDDGISAVEAAADSLNDWITNSGIVPPLVMFFGPGTKQGFNASMEAASLAALKKARAYNWAGLDSCQALGGNWEATDALGWGGDGVHLSQDAYVYLVALMSQQIGLHLNSSIIPRQVMSASTNPTVIGRSIVIRRNIADANTGVIYTDSVSGADVSYETRANRAHRFYHSTTEFAKFSANHAVQRSFIPSGFALGASTGPQIQHGSADPEGSVTAPVGSLYLRTSGGAGTTLYVKESGTGNTGWIGK